MTDHPSGPTAGALSLRALDLEPIKARLRDAARAVEIDHRQAFDDAASALTFEDVPRLLDEVERLRAALSTPAVPQNQEPLRALAARLQRKVHEDAVYAGAVAAMFSKAAWEHNAGVDWPEQPDDDSYLAFENCVHPDCVLARAALTVSTPAPREVKDHAE